MLTIGLIIGLFVAFLVYLDDLQEPPTAAVERAPDVDASQGRDVTGGQSADDEADKPKFEFYSILPELEVVVPDAPGKDTAKGATSSESAESESTQPDNDTPVGEGTFYLQAGSFQKEEQADRMKAKISLIGLDVKIQSVQVNGARWHRVRVGPYDDPEALRSAQKRLRENGIDYLVLRDKSAG